MPNHRSPAIAWFVTPHGFGHAARACAIMSALRAASPEIRFEIYTRVPHWFFTESLQDGFIYHPLLTDIGIVQPSPLQENLPETIARLEQFLPFKPKLISRLAADLLRQQCQMVVCDTAALGIAAAAEAKIPSVLIENFTWDWIYEGYRNQYPQFERFSAYLQGIYRQADHHIQTEPVCAPRSTVDLVSAPVSRSPRAARQQVRGRLDLTEQHRVIMITMGGIQEQFEFIARLQGSSANAVFILPGASQQHERRQNLILLPHHSNFYHPDLIFASDVVIGKAGYSTVAETYHAGLPFCFTSRPGFRESEPMSKYIHQNFRCIQLTPKAFRCGDWVDRLPELLAMLRLERQAPNGARQISDFLIPLMS